MHVQRELSERSSQLLHERPLRLPAFVRGDRFQLINRECDGPSVALRDILQNGNRIFVSTDSNEVL